MFSEWVPSLIRARHSYGGCGKMFYGDLVSREMIDAPRRRPETLTAVLLGKYQFNSTQYGENPVQTFLLSSFHNVGFIGVRDRASGADFFCDFLNLALVPTAN